MVRVHSRYFEQCDEVNTSEAEVLACIDSSSA